MKFIVSLVRKDLPLWIKILGNIAQLLDYILIIIFVIISPLFLLGSLYKGLVELKDFYLSIPSGIRSVRRFDYLFGEILAEKIKKYIPPKNK